MCEHDPNRHATCQNYFFMDHVNITKSNKKIGHRMDIDTNKQLLLSPRLEFCVKTVC